jgi:hypothetical protein
MNTLTKNIFKLNFNKRLINIIVKNKYRRDSQPGLSRYNWDQISYQQKPFEVNKY